MAARCRSSQSKKQRFLKNLQGFTALSEWLITNTKAQPLNIFITFEVTGVYHEGLAYHLHNVGFKVSVVNPARTKKYTSVLGIAHKTDKSDSLLLARFGYSTKPTQWNPEPSEARELSALIQRIEAIEKDIQREENRKEQAVISSVSEVVVESL